MDKNELIEYIDRAIVELVYDKLKFVKAYNYYYGKMDMDQYRHLEENYGIGTPTSIEFIPLVRRHIDVLVGEYLSLPISPKITCKDKETLSNIFRDKQLKINQEVKQELNKHLVNVVYAAIEGKSTGISDPDVENNIKLIIENIDRNFISEYEIAAQNIIQYLIHSRNIDFLNKLKLLLIDILVTGTCYYKVDESVSGTNVNFRVLNPLHTFIDRNPNSPYLRDSYRSVVREYKTKEELFNKYGSKMDEETIEILEKMSEVPYDVSNVSYVRASSKITGEPSTDGIMAGFEVTPMIPYERFGQSKNWRLFPVYEVEFLKSKKVGDEFHLIRYEGIRIAHNIYVDLGESETSIVTSDDPTRATLSVNGMFYSDRNTEPFSLVLSTANLQDKYNIMHFYRDNIIANSGTVGGFVDLAMLPKFLGNNTPERLIKFLAYKKAGIAPIDSSQEGAGLNTIFNGYDESVRVDTIQAINLVIQQIEETCSSVTGVFRERLGGIEQRDAVTNVAVGVKQSSLITKQYYQLMDLLVRDILLDSLNVGKKVFKKGLTGTYILGEKLNKIFTALPEHFTNTDFDLHISNTDDLTKEEETIKQIAMEFAKTGQVEPDIILQIISSKSMTRMKEDVTTSLEKKKKEMGQMSQLQQQLQQLQQQAQQAQQEAETYKQKFEKLNQDKLNLEQEKLNYQRDVEWYKAKSDSSFKEESVDLDKKRVQLEAAQLIDTDETNNEIRND